MSNVECSERDYLPDKMWLILKGMLEETDFNQITIQKLCTRTQIHRATFYRYFTDIFALLEYGLKTELTSYLDKVILDRGSEQSFKICLEKISSFRNVFEHLEVTNYRDIIFIKKYFDGKFDSQISPHLREHLIHFYTSGFTALIDLFLTDQTIEIDHLASDLAFIFRYPQNDFKNSMRHK